MAENVPPTSASKAAATTSNSDRGIPYYEKLRRDLRDTINKKRLLDRNLEALEHQIFRAETSYLEETSAAGNIVKGFDNYIKAAATTNSTAASGTISGAAAGGTRRKAQVNDSDRVFSKSSVSYRDGKDGESGPGSAVSTPGQGSTPVASAGGFEKDRKKKKGSANNGGDDDTDSRAPKRQKMSFTRKGHDD